MLWGLGLGREYGGLGSQVVASRFGVFLAPSNFLGYAFFLPRCCAQDTCFFFKIWTVGFRL